jgi:hypothetical protein
MTPRFWFSEPGLVATALRPLAPLWPRPARKPIPAGTIAMHAPLADPLTQALALVHLAQALPGSPCALLPDTTPDFDLPGFLRDFLPLVERPDARPCLALAPWPAPAAAKVLVIDAGRGFGNGFLRPAGPLHDTPATLLGWADHLLLIGASEQRQGFLAGATRLGWTLPPVLHAEIAPLAMGMDWQGSAVLAFSAGAFAPLLFAACRSVGADLRGAIPLPQGQPPAPALLRRLDAEAQRLGAQLVTTEADAQTLPPAFRRRVLAMPLRLSGAQGLGAAVRSTLQG